MTSKFKSSSSCRHQRGHCTATAGLLENEPFGHVAHDNYGSERMEEGETVKFRCAAHDRNEAMSCIPAKLCKRGVREINSAEDSGPVSLACELP